MKRLLFVFLVLLLACKSDPPATTDPTVAASRSASDSPRALLEQDYKTAGIHVIDTGGEPKESLRYTIAENATFTGVMRMHMDMRMTINGQSPPATKLPVMVMPMSIETGSMTDGQLPLTAVYLEMSLEETDGVPEQVQTGILQQINNLQGVKLTWNIDTRGTMTDLEFQTEGTVAPQIQKILEQTKQSFGNFFVVLPEEAVGPQAQWVMVLKDFAVGGIVQDIRAHYTVKEISDKHVTLDVTMLSVIEEQMIDDEQLKSLNMTSKVFPAKNFTSGTMTIDLNKPLPHSEVSGTSKVIVETSGEAVGPTPQRMETEMDLKLSMREK